MFLSSSAGRSLTARLRAARSARRPGGGRGPWRSLRHRSMRWWSLANLVSNVGTWMQLTAQNLLVLELTGSAALTGLSVSLQAAPGLLLGLAGGAAVDAWPRKLTAAVSQALLGAVAVVTAVLIAFDQLDVGVLMVLAVVTGLIATVDAPACALLGNDLVPPRDVPSAIAVGSLVHGVGRLAGAAAAGVLVSSWGPGAAYAANGLSFLFVASVIPFLRPAPGAVPVEPVALRAVQPGRATAATPATERRRGTGAGDGLVFFLRRPRLVALAAITAVSSVFGRNYTLTLAVLVTGPLAGGAAEFGAVSTVLAVGGVVGAVLAGRLTGPTVRLVGTMAAVGGLLQVAAGLSPNLAVLMTLIVPMAIVESVSDTAGTTVLQTDPPPRMRGRVLGVWRSVSTGWGLVGPPLLGLLMEWAGARGALVLGGALIAATVAAGAALHRRRVARPAAPRATHPATTARTTASTAGTAAGPAAAGPVVTAPAFADAVSATAPATAGTAAAGPVVTAAAAAVTPASPTTPAPNLPLTHTAVPATAGPAVAGSVVTASACADPMITTTPAAASAAVTSASPTTPAPNLPPTHTAVPPMPSPSPSHTAIPLMPSPRAGIHEALPVPGRAAEPAREPAGRAAVAAQAPAPAEAVPAAPPASAAEPARRPEHPALR